MRFVGNEMDVGAIALSGDPEEKERIWRGNERVGDGHVV